MTRMRIRSRDLAVGGWGARGVGVRDLVRWAVVIGAVEGSEGGWRGRNEM